VLAAYAVLYELAPWHLPTDAWWVWVALFFADDLSYYWFHRVSHESRVFWASHVVHHSSQHYNLSTALRQTWVPMTYAPFWLWMPLVGFAPWMVLLAQAWSLIYQFGIHTERIGRLPRPVELVLNTPSHHRVHHGSNEQYLDKNYGGILVIWDRLFGTFEPEGERVRYGLTTDIDTYNPVRVAFHEYIDLWRDVRRARSWRTRWGLALHGPGWRPEAEPDLEPSSASRG
jgi:sterol desaturase/sphingolipid hydroxylase (fatty acid hydroxylase superfamily)